MWRVWLHNVSAFLMNTLVTIDKSLRNDNNSLDYKSTKSRYIPEMFRTRKFLINNFFQTNIKCSGSIKCTWRSCALILIMLHLVLAMKSASIPHDPAHLLSRMLQTKTSNLNSQTWRPHDQTLQLSQALKLWVVCIWCNQILQSWESCGIHQNTMGVLVPKWNSTKYRKAKF
jgi:hypothetical protein